MNEKRMTWLLPVFAGMLTVGILIAGCEIDSAESATRSVNIDVEGFYSNPDGGPMVENNTGQPITDLNVRQAGDRLEAIDNSGMIYKGTIGQVIGDSDPRSATFTLTGNNTAGHKATWSGNFEVAGTVSTMSGTWIEDAYYSRFHATAKVNPLPTPSPSPTATPTGGVAIAVSPSSATISVNNDTEKFTASGGSGSYTWSVNNSSYGTLNNSSGASVTYTRKAAGNNSITVKDTDNNSTTVSITQPAAAAIAISPTSKTLNSDNETVAFTASGGSGSYTWFITSSTFGSLNTSQGSAVTYTRKAAGSNIITVSDTDSGSASATITQP